MEGEGPSRPWCSGAAGDLEEEHSPLCSQDHCMAGRGAAENSIFVVVTGVLKVDTFRIRERCF